MTWVAAGALVVWCGSVLAGRLALAHRWAGIDFVTLAWRRWSAGEWVAALLATFSGVSLLGGLAFALTGGRAGLLFHASSLWVVPAAALLATSTALMVWSQQTMGASWRIGVDRRATTTLVTVGPFRLVRNPIYTAMVTSACGLTLLVPSIALVAATAAMVAFVEWQVRVVEEPHLAQRHRYAYDAWCRRAGRFVPLVGRRRTDSPT